MAVGDAVGLIQSVPAGGVIDLQPAGTVQWVIHNIYHEFDINLILYDGVNSLTFDTSTGSGILARFTFHPSNSLWIRVKNNDLANARLIGYDGIVSHT